MRPPTDSRRLIPILLASPYRHRQACTPAPCFLGLRPLVPINLRALLVRHCPLRARRKEWFLITGTPQPQRTHSHRLPMAPRCRRRVSRRITSSTHRLPVIPRIGRRIPRGLRLRAIRPRRRPVLLRRPSALARSHPAPRPRLKREKRARTVWRHREGRVIVRLCLFSFVSMYTVRIVLVLHIFHPMLCV